jgi:hypothetical protein
VHLADYVELLTELDLHLRLGAGTMEVRKHVESLDVSG